MIETERLLLRKCTTDDVDEVFNIYSNESDEYCYTHIPHPYMRKDAIEFIERSIKVVEEGKELRLLIVDKETDKILGELVGKHLDDENDCVEVGYSLGKDSRNKGIITEAARVLIDYLFKSCGINRVQLLCSTENIASQKVMQKLGAVHEGVCREASKLRGRYHDEHMYSILKSDWE